MLLLAVWKTWGEQMGFELPKGAGPRVIEVAKKIVQMLVN